MVADPVEQIIRIQFPPLPDKGIDQNRHGRRCLPVAGIREVVSGESREPVFQN